MNSRYLLSLLGLCAMLLTACTLPRDAALQEQADQLSACDKVKQLAAAYTSGFEAIKGPSLSQRFLDIWAARVHVVGEECQIWKSGHHTTYMCTRHAPNQTVAAEWFDQAAGVIGECLGDWKQVKTSASEEGGRGLVWSGSKAPPSVGLQLVPSGRNHWTVYYFIGDRDKWF